MNKKNTTKLAESILCMLEKKDNTVKSEFTSLNDCFLGMAVMQAAQREISENVLKNLESINEMAREGLITRGVHYKAGIDAEGDYVLKLNYIAFYDRFIGFCRKSKAEHELFDLREFKLLLRIQKYCKAYNMPAWFNVLAGCYSFKKQFRCAVLKINDLKELNCKLDCLIGK